MTTTSLPDIHAAQRPMSRASQARSLRSVAASGGRFETQSVHSGVSAASRAEGSKASATSSVVNLRRRQSLRNALVEKLLAKYFPGIANSKTEKLIHSEVDALIEKGMVTEQDLRDAESRIRKQSNIDVAYIATNPFKLVVSHKSIEKDEWAQVNSSKYAKGMIQEKKQKDMNDKRQEEFRSSLDKQREALENRRAADQLAKQAEAQQLEADAQRFKMEQERQRREHENKIARIKRDMDEQMAEMKRKKEAATAAAKAEQQASIAKLRQIQMQEAEQLRQQKEENLKKMAKWKQDNERNMAAREDLKQQEILRDQEMIVKARQVADEAERKRLKELEILKAKMKAKEAMGEAMGADRDALLKADEERMLKVQKELQVMVDAQIKAKKEAAEQVKLSIRQSLDKQMRDRARREEREAAEREKQARIDADKVVKAAREQERKDQQHRFAMNEYRLELEDQIRADMRNRPGRDRRMTDLERALNFDHV